MKAQVLYGINQLKYERDYKEPEMTEGEVLIKVKACGICGSDTDRVMKNGTYHFPIIIGHEFSGQVVETKNSENKYLIGKSVTVFPLIPCRKCNPCMKGDYHLCESYDYFGSRRDGGFAERVAVPAWNLLEIPGGISYEEAAMLEPCAVAFHALKKCGSLLGKRILITGSGAIASILAQIAISAGASKTMLTARDEKKLVWIKEKIPSVEIVPLEGLRETFDVVVEGTGAPSVIETALASTERQGHIVLMGNPSGNICLARNVFWQILRKELNLSGTWNSSFGISGKNDWLDAFALLASRRIVLEPMITHRLKLENLMDGILLMKNKSELSNKVMVVYE